MYCDALVTLVWTTDLKMFIRVEIQNTLRFPESIPESPERNADRW